MVPERGIISELKLITIWVHFALALKRKKGSVAMITHDHRLRLLAASNLKDLKFEFHPTPPRTSRLRIIAYSNLSLFFRITILLRKERREHDFSECYAT